MPFKNEKILETKQCTHCSSTFEITDKDLEFYNKISPIFNDEKYSIPTPKLCPDCRQQRRLSFSNARKLYKRKCDATGKDIISIYSTNKKYSVYNNSFWWSDNWSIEDYILDFDSNKKVSDQFLELFNMVPKRALIKGTGSKKCDYVNLIGASNNCYLLFDSNNCENCFFGNGMVKSIDCLDSTYSSFSESCYMIIDSKNCYGCYYVSSSINCSKSSYLYNCENCSHCFGCVNISNKKYSLFNEQYSKEEYFRKLDELQENYSFDDFKKFKIQYPVKNLLNINSEHISGDRISNSSSVKDSFEVYDSENIIYSAYVHSGSYNCMDTNVVLNDSHDIYETALINKFCSNMIFCYDCWTGCINLIYCTECKNTKHSILCHGLVGKEYCILNKQYTPEEYNILVPKIINHMKETGEWGEFFPSSISPFGYNETAAQEYFPLEKQEALKSNFNWSDYEAPLPKVDKIIPASKLPDNISDIPDDIINWAIECEITKKPFRIIPQELEFYRKHSLPIPKRHPDQRHLDRMKLRNPRKLFKRDCDKCGIEMDTTYAPERPEQVYCEECYNKEVY